VKLNPIIAAVVGAFLASIVWYFPFKSNAGQLSQTMDQLQSAKRTLAQAEAQNAQLQSSSNQNSATLAADNQNLSTQLAACQTKFGRGTFLYDVGLLGNETRAWFVPADVEPVRIGRMRGTYSHYDPKAQTETVHLAAKTQ
jgi:hypothetical protein